MARKVRPHPDTPPRGIDESARLDAPDPSVDPRFRFWVSVPPLTYVASTKAGWSGALLVEGDSGFVRSGEVRQEHQALFLQRWQTPNVARPIGSRGGWTTFAPGVRLLVPGDREYDEWCGRPRAQSLYLAPERVEAVLGRSWDLSGLMRWREPRHQLPFVDHVISAMMQDFAAGHPAGPITGDSLVVALLRHLDGADARAPSPSRGALGRRLDAVCDYIEESLSRPIRLEDLAALAGVGVRQFGVVFAAETGCTPQRYLLLRRIQRATTLLRDPALTLDHVARAAGFTGATQLSRVLWQHAGRTPGAYRRH